MRRLLLSLLIAFAIITPVRFFVAQPFIVSGGSMEPLLQPKDYLVVDRWSYREREPERGEVIVFRYPLDPDQIFVKRVAGLPGETVVLEGGTVRITTPSGETFVLDEPYKTPDRNPEEDKKLVLHDDEYFVLGDNRTASADSRVWGPLLERFIIGRAAARLFPLSRASLAPGALAHAASTSTDIHTE